MDKKLNRALQRMIMPGALSSRHITEAEIYKARARHAVFVGSKSVFISSNNACFPKLAESAEARIIREEHLKPLPIKGRVPCVE